MVITVLTLLLQTIIKTATTKTATATNTDISLSDLSANTRYDLSINQFNIYDMSNSKATEYAITRPTDFIANDITQNIGASTHNKLVMNVSHSQVAGTLDISGYTIDVSGNNGVNATSQTIIKTATIKTAHSANTDVSFSDLSANTRYDLSINQFNIYDISNSKATEYAVTRPTDFTNNGNDVSQNMTASLVLTDRLTMNVIHKDVAGTLDISGYTVNYSVLGGNTDAGSFTKTATNKDATDSNTDVLISGLNYPNSVYDMSVNLFNAYDMSNTFIEH